MTSHQGGCLCGQVRFELSNEADRVLICHCSTCRKAVGAVGVAWVVAHLDDFAWLSNKPADFQSSPDVTRTFCPICGTSLTYSYQLEPTKIDITLATFDNPNAFTPTLEIWTSHNLTWENDASILDSKLEE